MLLKRFLPFISIDISSVVSIQGFFCFFFPGPPLFHNLAHTAQLMDHQFCLYSILSTCFQIRNCHLIRSQHLQTVIFYNLPQIWSPFNSFVSPSCTTTTWVRLMRESSQSELLLLLNHKALYHQFRLSSSLYMR